MVSIRFTLSPGVGVARGMWGKGSLLRPSAWPLSLPFLCLSVYVYAYSIIAHLRILGEALSGKLLFSPNSPNNGL